MGTSQHRQGSRVRGRRAHRTLQARHRFDVVVEHVRALVEDAPERHRVSLAVRDQDLHSRTWATPAERFDRRRERRGAAVFEVVASDTGYDCVSEAKASDGFSHTFGLLWVEWHWFGGIDLAKAARTRATVTVDHEGRGPVSPTFEDVGATRLLANRHEPEAAYRLAQ